MSNKTGKATTLVKSVGAMYEMDPGKEVKDSPLYNEDVAPTKTSQRTCHTWNVAALWVGMAVCVPTYTLDGVLTAYFGLDVTEALITIFLANVVVLIPLILNAFAGTKYGIPFPVLLRSSFGTIGSNIPAVVRALVACGWFGIQTMFGGMAINLLLSELSTSWAALGEKGTVIGFFHLLVHEYVCGYQGFRVHQEARDLCGTIAAPGRIRPARVGLPKNRRNCTLWRSPEPSC